MLRRKVEVVVALLEKGADVSYGTLYGQPILEWSALMARDVHKVLLESVEGSELVSIGDIVSAAEAGTPAFANFLRHYGAKLTHTQLEEVIAESLTLSKFRATAVLLENDVDPNGSTLEESEHQLMVIPVLDDTKYSELLINKGASANLPGLLVSAVDNGNLELVDLLIDKGADLETYGPDTLEKAAE